jgi:hypothetical protein
MATGFNAANKIITVVRSHVGDDVLEKILSDLEKVQSNKSFQETNKRLKNNLNDRRKE